MTNQQAKGILLLLGFIERPTSRGWMLEHFRITITYWADTYYIEQCVPKNWITYKPYYFRSTKQFSWYIGRALQQAKRRTND